MALYDNKWWLLSHIQHSFLLSDDTGNTEMVFTRNDENKVRKECAKRAEEEGTKTFFEAAVAHEKLQIGGGGGNDDKEEEEDETDAAHSYEIRSVLYSFSRFINLQNR